MDKKRVFRISSFVLFGIGAFLIINSQADITGALIGVPADYSTGSLIGFLMIMACVVLFMASLEERAHGRGKKGGHELDLRGILESALEESERVEEVHIDVPLSHYSSVTPTNDYREVEGERLRLYEGVSTQDGRKHMFTIQPLQTTRLDLGRGKSTTVPTKLRICFEDEEGKPKYKSEPIDWEKAVRDNEDLFREHHVDVRKVLQDLREYKSKPKK